MNRLWGIIAVVVVIGGAVFVWYYMRSSATVTTAQMVAACETAHHLQRQSDVINGENGATLGSCEWPPPTWADRDGYYQIVVSTKDGPGQGEASDADQADYITIPCGAVALAYDFGSQGAFEHRPPITVKAGEITGEDGAVSKDLRSNLPTYPSRDEVVFLHNMKMRLVSARCVVAQ